MSRPHLQSLLITFNWNRLILNILWAISFVVFASQWLIFKVITTKLPFLMSMNDLEQEMLIPNSISLIVMVGLELWHRTYPKWTEGAILTASITLSFVYLYFISDYFAAAPVILLFPIFISTIYFKKKDLLICLVICVGGLIGCYFMYEDHSPYTMINFIIITCTILIAALTGFAVIERGSELVTQLDSVQQSEQELRVQTILMERMAKIDPLTGLHNHKSFHEYIEKLLEDQRLHAFPIQLAILDIDNFKQVNDTYGHWAGDIALKQAAGCMADYIGKSSFAARYGGEEFVILLRENNIQAAWQIIEKLRIAIARSPIAEMNRRHISVSIGLHQIEAGETKEYAFQQADQALYVSKREGKNRTTIQ
ncbi:GGDEF domain-containing protein [Paenibacillus sinopodophylli]|uniref:GGDEF domain-containing protein n=1 Tax=Paenibacillus sinopodophylli TaxID=1837342 RepID=UPI001486DAE7|nr:GGDEF domain-containing protein [Paenibacillus sinopodophylli]